jgi:hypothetical protein
MTVKDLDRICSLKTKYCTEKQNWRNAKTYSVLRKIPVEEKLQNI